jgi:hypothetical protein
MLVRLLCTWAIAASCFKHLIKFFIIDGIERYT